MDHRVEPSRRPPIPIACTLTPASMTTRLHDWQIALDHVVGRSAITGGVRLALSSDAPIAEIARLAVAEHECCAFFEFALHIGAAGIALEVTAPDDARDLVTALFGGPH